VGRRIQRLRRTADLTVKDLAEAAGVSVGHVRDIETAGGGVGCSVDLVERLVHALVPADQVERVLIEVLHPEVRQDDAHRPDNAIDPSVRFTDAERILALQVADLTKRLADLEYFAARVAAAVGGDVGADGARTYMSGSVCVPSGRTPISHRVLDDVARSGISLARSLGSRAYADAVLAWATDPHRSEFQAPTRESPHGVGARRRPDRVSTTAATADAAPSAPARPVLRLLHGGAS
jgi:hypothetical protein